MTDRPDPRLSALPYLPLNVATPQRLLRDLDTADRAAGIVRVDTRDEALAKRLVSRQSHADWCCTKGCVEDRKMHRDVDFVEGRPVLVGEYPCPGTCTCEVDGITRAVLAALREAP